MFPSTSNLTRSFPQTHVTLLFLNRAVCLMLLSNSMNQFLFPVTSFKQLESGNYILFSSLVELQHVPLVVSPLPYQTQQSLFPCQDLDIQIDNVLFYYTTNV